jgi:hypothetical protein
MDEFPVLTHQDDNVTVSLNVENRHLTMVKNNESILYKTGDILCFFENGKSVQWKYKSTGWGSRLDNKKQKRSYYFNDLFYYDQWNETTKTWRSESCYLQHICVNFDNINVCTFLTK